MWKPVDKAVAFIKLRFKESEKRTMLPVNEATYLSIAGL